MKTLILITLLAFNTYAADDRQFPNPDQIYIPGKDIGFSKYLTKSLRATNKIALTFDDGPDVNLTPKLLDTLKAYNVKATFFILTERINAQTLPIIKRMVAEGHNVASHHHDHISSDLKSETVYRAGLKKSILATAGIMEEENSLNREVYYRFPYGAYGSKKLAYHHMNVMKDVSKELFGDNCINFVFWDIDTADWLETITSAEITQGVMANFFGGTAYTFEYKNGKYIKIKYTIKNPIGGGVSLMHDVHAHSVAAVPMMLEKFKEKGIEVVPLQEVEEFAYNGKECRLINSSR
jgi:peptidoglycan/xylan/chitin deacetylase (PgdA/CDA1 family)